MAEWWNSLDLFKQIMVCIAVPSTLIIVIQLILMLIGLGGDDSFDAVDSDVDVAGIDADLINDEGFLSLGGLRVLTLRSVLAFLSAGSCLALALSYTMNQWLALLLGVLGGALMGISIALGFHFVLKLQASGNINYKKAVGLVGTVYLRIPPKRAGKGKINITLQERFVDVDAVTDEEEMIDTGLPVKVVEVEDDNTMVVKRYRAKKPQKGE